MFMDFLGEDLFDTLHRYTQCKVLFLFVFRELTKILT